MWQRFVERHPDKSFAMVAVAVDVLGAKAARPYVEKAGATYPNLVDPHNLLADLFGFKSVPHLLKIDERGVYRGLAKDEAEAARWIEEAAPPPPRETDGTVEPSVADLRSWTRAHPEDHTLQLRLGEALVRTGQYGEAEEAYRAALRLRPDSAPILFRLGGALAAQGRKQEAVRLWREALKRDPKNWLIRKQIWAVEHPERFYEGDVDFEWQKTQQ